MTEKEKDEMIQYATDIIAKALGTHPANATLIGCVQALVQWNDSLQEKMATMRSESKLKWDYDLLLDTMQDIAKEECGECDSITRAKGILSVINFPGYEKNEEEEP